MMKSAAEAERKNSWTSEEQRLAIRVPVDFQASFAIAGRPPGSGRITEISRTGLRLLTQQQIAPGTTLEVTFEPIIFASSKPASRVRVGGRVARLIGQVGPAYEYGILVVGDSKAKSAMQRTVIQMSLLTFDSCLGESATLKQPGGESKKPTRSLDERRRFMRAAVDFEASYTISGLPAEPARVTEISKTGLRLLAGQRFAVGAFVEITFEPTFGSVANARRRVCVRGRVARLVREGGPPFEHGVEVMNDMETKCTLQWAVLQVGLKAASKRNEGSARHYINDRTR